jgi:hypothetical protein
LKGKRRLGITAINYKFWRQTMAAMNGYKHIGKVKLLTTYKIYQHNNKYIIRSTSRNDPSNVYEKSYNHSVIMKLKKKYSGQSISVNDIIDDIENQRFSIKLQNKYGHKQRYEIQNILVILCGLKLASRKKKGRQYIYEVKK